MVQSIAVIGGDARYIELIRYLDQVDGYVVQIVGYEKLKEKFSFLNKLNVHINELERDQLDVVILPLQGIDQDGIVQALFSNEAIQLSDDWFKSLNRSTQIFTGVANDHLVAAAIGANLKLTPLMARDDVAIYNSIPTAEGTIMLAMEKTESTIHGANVFVAGFGRVGQTVANKFAALGANVSVCSISSIDLARATEIGLGAIAFEDLKEHANRCDILINTIPALVITKDIIEGLSEETLIIDLASSPGGVDFESAKSRGIEAVLAPGLPGIVAPKTAGKILAQTIEKLRSKVEGVHNK